MRSPFALHTIDLQLMQSWLTAFLNSHFWLTLPGKLSQVKIHYLDPAASALVDTRMFCVTMFATDSIAFTSYLLPQPPDFQGSNHFPRFSDTVHHEHLTSSTTELLRVSVSFVLLPSLPPRR